MRIICWCAMLTALLVSINARSQAQTSTQEHGSVSVAADSISGDGRLIIRVAVLNRTKTAVELGDNAIQVFTSTGTPIKLVTLDQLIREVKSSHRRQTGTTQAPLKSEAGSNGLIRDMRDSGGNPIADNTAADTRIITGDEKPAEQLDDKAKAQIAALKAGVLQPQTVAPGQIVSGQIVTEKLELSKKQPHVVKVDVVFDGETHEFNLALPDNAKTK